MKEAYGGATNLYLFLFFFVVYVSFLAFALQFAKAYRVKNYVIDALEQGQYDGEAMDSGTNREIAEKLHKYFLSIPYTGVNNIADDFCKDNSDNGTYMLILMKELALLSMVKKMLHIIKFLLLLILVYRF